MIRWLMIACVLFFHLGSYGQTSSYLFRNISINEGLSQSSVTDIAVDERGFLWLATQDGLNRFDGTNFISFRKTFDDITTTTGSQLGKIYPGGKNELYLITSGGILQRFNLYTQQFVEIRNLGDTNVTLPSVSCFFYQDSNALWVGTRDQGLFLFHPLTKKSIHFTGGDMEKPALTGNYIQYIFSDSRRRKWILTDKGINCIENGLTIRSYLPAAHSPGIRTVAGSAMDEDSGRNLWLGTFGDGLYIKKDSDTAFQPFRGFGPDQYLPPDLVVEALKIDNSGKVWVGTYGNGLFIIDVKKQIITHAGADSRNPFSLGFNDVLCIREDAQHGIWIGTDGGGVSHYDKRLNNFSLLSKYNVPSDIAIEQVRSVATDNEDGLWIGTSNNGLTYTNIRKKHFRSLSVTPLAREAGSRQRIVSLLSGKSNDIWIGTQGNGLLLLNRDSKKIKKTFSREAAPPFRLPDNTIWCMLPEGADQIWAGTRNGGLCLIDPQRGLLKQYSAGLPLNSTLAENNIRSIIRIDDTTICIGFDKLGVQLLNTRTGELTAIATADNNNIMDGVTRLRCLYYRAPYLWIGTIGKGLIAYNLRTREEVLIDKSHGLPSNTVYGILSDRQGRLWMSTNKGICRMTVPDDLITLNRSYFVVFTVEDGLQSNEFNTGAYHASANGMFYFGGIKGLNIFNPDSLSLTNQPIPVALTQAMVNNEALILDTGITYKKTIRLQHDQNSLAFSFAALDFVSPGRINYYYRMEGYDESWVASGDRNYAAYTNLPAGTYDFKVMASRNIFKMTDPVTTIRIVIEPPFWNTWWFLVLCLLAVAALLYGIYRNRIIQLLRLQRIRNRIASDLHDDIGSSLTNISILSELSRKNAAVRQDPSPFLSRISEEVRNSSQALDDIVWSINIKYDTLEQTVMRMRRYAAEIFDGANIRYSLQFDEQFARRKLNMEQRRDCFLMFKEIINNVYKHAGATDVLIRVGIDKNQLYMHIEDNGIGFKTGLSTQRNGLKNLAHRAIKWKGRFTLESSPGNGTQISIHLPVA